MDFLPDLDRTLSGLLHIACQNAIDIQGIVSEAAASMEAPCNPSLLPMGSSSPRNQWPWPRMNSMI